MDRLDDWLGGIQPRLGHLEDFQLPEDFPLDFSLASRERLERRVGPDIPHIRMSPVKTQRHTLEDEAERLVTCPRA